MSRIIFTPQHDQMDCGPACLAMVASRHGKKYSLQYLREQSFITREGVSLQGIKEAANTIGLRSHSARVSIQQLIKYRNLLPAILHWNQNHFVVLKKISIHPFSKKITFHIADPGHGFIKMKQENFEKHWISHENMGVAVFFDPKEEFYNKIPPKENKISIKHLFSYLKSFNKQIIILFILLLFGSILNLTFPFLTQNLIDQGISSKNLNFVTMILLAQLCVFVGVMIFEILRNWILLSLGTKVSITIISQFLKKLLTLPIRYFETKMRGDFNQRIQDNERIEQFLTSQSLTTFFSILTFTVFFGVLLYYNYTILTLYLILTAFALIWSFYWLKRRKTLDYFSFQYRSENQESIYEMLEGVSEMKLHQFEDFKRKNWEAIQYKLFHLNRKILKNDQIQLSGFEFFNQVKNILVTFVAATLVIKNSMTLGELLAVSYIIGQMNAPINQLVNFFRSLQDAKLSLERLSEVHNYPAEEQTTEKINLNLFKTDKKNGIELKNLYFQYGSPESEFVLKNINLLIEDGKTTAIVGTSGSGKTTLMKLLLKFYPPTKGSIFYNGINLENISPKSIREHSGVVMQDGYIFSDSIARNIAMGEKNIEEHKLQNALKIANIKNMIDELPLGYNTKIGLAGNSLSGGQKQRILIARAAYRNPHYIFFDEATSSLDAENEKIIHDHLHTFFNQKTVIVIAHRLSTVKKADKIVVLHKGEIVEQGTHKQLIAKREYYYRLVKNQLELGE